MNDPKLKSASFQRNIEPIIELFIKILLDPHLRWLEIGSGSGQHIIRFGHEFPDFEFYPTDIEQHFHDSIKAWASDAGVTNVREPSFLDVTADPWLLDTAKHFDIISAFNVIHIAPWNVTDAVFRGASQHGSQNCRIFLYGPFRVDGEHTSESNAKFDEWLKEKSGNFGVRDVADVNQVALSHGFTLSKQHAMPSNNFMMEFTRVRP